jgi:hypothetical protein
MFRTTLMTFAAALALSALAAPSALAASTNNPRWEVAKELLGEGKSEAVEVSQNGVQKLNMPIGNPLECRKIKAETPAAKILGSKAPNAGTGEETLTFEECEYHFAPECEINKEKAGKAKIKTNLLQSTLVFETKAGAESEAGQTLTLLQPKSGKLWASVDVRGNGCPFTGETRLEGQVAALNVNGGEELASHELKFPEVHIGKYFVNESGKTVEKYGVELHLFGLKITWIGKTTLKLTSNKLWKIFG